MPRHKITPEDGRALRFNGVNAALPDALFNDIDPQTFRQRERPVDRRVCELATLGYTCQEIAATLDRTPANVSNILRQPFARKYMIERVQQTANNEIKELLEKVAPESIKRIAKLAEAAPNTKLGFAADVYLVDRFMGKAVQPIRDEDELKKLTPEELKAIAGSPQ